ncbi:MAG: hypothetical protein AVDCRST_MAG93-9725, partial [uncultured Chloroflexia bacterium]
DTRLFDAASRVVSKEAKEREEGDRGAESRERGSGAMPEQEHPAAGPSEAAPGGGLGPEGAGREGGGLPRHRLQAGERAPGGVPRDASQARGGARGEPRGPHARGPPRV